MECLLCTSHRIHALGVFTCLIFKALDGRYYLIMPHTLGAQKTFVDIEWIPI